MSKQNHPTNTQTGTRNGRKETFSFASPAAMSVQLVGDFTDWQQHPVNMHKSPDGIWRATVKLEPGMHQYRFLEDGKWREDPECASHVSNPYGGQDAVREVT